MTGGSTSTAFRRFTLATVLVTYLLIVWGGIVRVTGSGRGCDSPSGGKDSWPLCDGSFVPPFTQASLIEFTHRWLATIVTVLIAGLVIWVLARYRSQRRLAVAAGVAFVLFVIQVALGALTIATKEAGWVVTVHLANALLLLAVLVFIAVTAATAGLRWSNAPSKSRLALIAAAFTYLVVITGSNVVAQSAGGTCYGWPFCAPNGGLGFTLAQTGPASVNLLHRFSVGILVLLVGASVPLIRKVHPGDRGLKNVGIAINALLLLQILAGALVVELNLQTSIRGVHLALASALWVAVVCQALLARRVPAVHQETSVGVIG